MVSIFQWSQHDIFTACKKKKVFKSGRTVQDPECERPMCGQYPISVVSFWA